MGRLAGITSAVGAAAAFAGLGLWNVSGSLADAPAAAAAQQALDAVPLAVGRWRGEPVPVTDKTLRTAEADAHLSRAYRHADSGRVVSVLVLGGPAGPLATHTPEVCYRGLGYSQAGPTGKRLLTIAYQPAEFRTGRYAKDGSPTLSVTWGWAVGRRWSAADTPQWEYAGADRLLKVYASFALPPDGGGADPTDEFLQEFLAALDRCLTP